MSGTSLDGVDGVLARLEHPQAPVAARAHAPLPAPLRDTLLALNTPAYDELARAAQAANALADVYAEVVLRLLREAGVPAAAVQAVGAHGQTVRHAPWAGYTIQLNAPARLAERTGITVVADFRSRDVAAGGQGAPLVPAFHAAHFGGVAQRAVLNLGGIANLSWLDAPVRGSDTGPANLLMDTWVQRHLGQPFDADGAWAASGHCSTELLEALLADPWFARPAPKSTGREQFNLAWLQARLDQLSVAPDAADVQRTLLELTARSVVRAMSDSGRVVRELLVCGGGAYNRQLLQRLQQLLPGVRVADTGACGVAPEDVEALAFAWLAQACLQGRATCGPDTTGARHPSVAGCIYPGVPRA